MKTQTDEFPGRALAVAISIDRPVHRELKCFLCGYLLGDVVLRAQSRQFRPAPDYPSQPEQSARPPRCPRCDGPVYLEFAESIPEWSIPPIAGASRSA